MLDLFEVESRHRIRQLLCFNLAAIISQRLLLSVAKGVSRVPATEVLVMSPDVRKFISEDRDTELVDAMRSHELEGMHTFATNLCELIETGMVHPEAAYAVAPNPDELRMLVKGISTSRVGLRSDSRSLDFRAGPKE
jgi:twitching motility protein PilT